MRHTPKKNIKLLLILVIVLAFIPYKLIFSKADESADNTVVTNEIVSEEKQETPGEQAVLNSGNEDEKIENVVESKSEETQENKVENTVSENKDNQNTATNTVDTNTTNTSSETNTTNTEAVTNKTADNSTETDVDENEISQTPLKFNANSNVNLTDVGDVDAADSNSEYQLQATLWDTIQYSAGTGTELTESGVVINNWQSETNKYLQIDPQVPADGNTYVVTVELPQEFYIVGTELAVPAGYQSVDFTKNESIVINSSTTYGLNTYSGTAEYTLNNMGVSGTIQVGIGYDVVLWDKQANSPLTPEGVYPIVVKLSRKEANGDMVELRKLVVSEALSGTGIKDAFGYYASIEGESNNVQSINVSKDTMVVLTQTINNNSGEARYKYYPSATITVKMPSYNDSSGNVYYLDFDESSLNLSKIQYTSKVVDTSQIDNGIIVITLENPYWKTGNFVTFKAGPLPTELEAHEANSFVFKSGTITTVVNGKNGNNDILYGNVNIATVTYQKATLEKVVISSTSKSVTLIERPEGAVSIFGGIYLENTGTGDSCAKNVNIEFDITNTNLIRVTTVNVMADTVQEYMDVKYTLVDENGERVYLDADGNRVNESSDDAIGEWTYSLKNTYYKSSSKKDLKNRLTRNNLPEAHRQYYFKTINYTLESILSQTKLYAQSSNLTLTAAGNFLGYVDDEKGKNGDKAITKATIVSENTSIANLERTITTTLSNTSTPTYVIDSAKISKTNIQAGESVNISGVVVTPSYPYGNSTWLKGITIAVKLPKDITINEEAIVIKNAKGQAITVESVATQALSDGNVLWKIKLPSDVFIGKATESVGDLPSGTKITYNIQLDTSYTMNATTIYVRDMVTVAGYMQTNSASGSYTWGSKVDTYDLNENGSVTDKIGGIDTTNAANCQIVSQTATLDVTDSITIESNGSVSSESSEGILNSIDDIVNYNLDIGCFSGGRAEGFCYYVPIPKTTTVTDNFLIENGQNGKFELSLKEEPSLTGSDIFEIGYIMQEGVTYANAQNIQDWYTKDQIDSDESLKYEDVTMIRLMVKEAGIKNGDKTRLSLKLNYSGDAFVEEAGMENVWHSGGFYKHINSDRESAGNFSTEGISITLNSEIECEDITLTAARNMNPVTPGNVNEITVEKDSFPVFKNAHTFKITNVETYNVTLQTKDYMIANPDMPGIDANKTFAITTNMDADEKNILSTASTTPITVGTSSKDDSPEFTYKIYNADALNDNSQTRYIVVTFESDNGITLKQRIDINREVVQASDPKIAIVEGKRYLTFDDLTTEAVISQDSAFTAQFILEYIPETYVDERITFSNALPVGTKITLVNLTDSSNPTYWYYSVGSAVTTVKLKDFVSIGKTGNDKYDVPDDIDIINEKLLVVVDFAQCTSCLSTGSYNIKLELTGKNDDVEDFSSSELVFITKNKNAFSLSNITGTNMGKDFTVNYAMTLTEGADSKYEGRKASLVITAPDNIPVDTMLTVQNAVYYLNSEKQYIISLGDIKTQSGSLTMNIFSNMQPSSDTTYEFDFALWVSATANADAPKLGELIVNKKVNITSNNELNPSLKVMKMNSRIIKKDKLSETYTMTYNYIPDTNCKVTVELQQKIGSAYQKVTDKLNQVNGLTSHTMGVFNISPSSGENKLEFKLSSTTEKSTYRIVFKVSDESGTKLLEVPYNFIVLDK